MNQLDIRIKNFRVAMRSHINALENQMSQVDKEEHPMVWRHYEAQLKESQTLLYELTGAKAKDFSDLLCTI